MFTSPLLSFLAAKSTDKSGGTTPLKLTDFKYFCYKGARINELSKFDTSAGTQFSRMFSDYIALVTAPYFDTSSGKLFVDMFNGCTALVNVPDYDCSSLVQCAGMFAGCTSLAVAPNIDTSKVTWISYMFKNCTSLIEVTTLDTRSAIELNELFNGCTALTTISGLDLSKATNLGWLIKDCSSLTNLYLYNISANLTIGSGTLWGHLLTVDSIVNTIKELVTVETKKTLSMGSANLEKIANLYCKVTDNTTAKLTMELCESTDEGAMLLSEYAAMKNWEFA